MMTIPRALVLSLLVACVQDDELADGVDDSFTSEDSKTDDGTIEPMLEIRAVLRIANTASLETLDDEIALDSRAANNIVARRPFADYAQLDAVPYVGPVAFGKLRAYALSRPWQALFQADFALDIDVAQPVTTVTWFSIAQGGPYTPKTTVAETKTLHLRLTGEGGVIQIGDAERSSTLSVTGEFTFGHSYSRLAPPDERFYEWGSTSVGGYIDPLGEIVITHYRQFAGRGNSIYGYAGTERTLSYEGHALLP
jgi:hypothetical protein